MPKCLTHVIPQPAAWDLNQHSSNEFVPISGPVGTNWIKKCQIVVGAEVCAGEQGSGVLAACSQQHPSALFSTS